MNERVVAMVAVDVGVYYLDKLYDYLIPSELIEHSAPGSRVSVPFGRGNRRKQGVIIALKNSAEFQNLKPIISIEDAEPILNAELLGLARWLKDNTFCLWFDAFRTMIPYGIACKIVEKYRINDGVTFEDISKLPEVEQGLAKLLYDVKGQPLDTKKIAEVLGFLPEQRVFSSLCRKSIILRTDNTVRNMNDPTVRMVKLNETDDNSPPPKLTKKQSDVLKVLSDIGTCSVKELCYFSGVTQAVVRALCKKGLATEYDCEVTDSHNCPDEKTQPHKTENLTEEQSGAYNTLLAKYRENKGSAALLYGITGSGKTQVFLKLCDTVLKDGKNVIVMVPEISLTPQMLGIFRSRFGNGIAVFHSNMSQGKRMDEWKRVKAGKARLVLGTRSAAFAPLENIGLIIMDEEQEHTYKSEKSPRFHARDVARYRAAKNNALLLLASATPSIETYAAAESGRYTLCTLQNRYGNAHLPEVIAVDMKKEQAEGNTGILSKTLYDMTEQALAAHHQVILLLNRRGYNTYISCPSCGYVASCPNCSISMTYHSANNRLMCHYCGYSEDLLSACPNCGSNYVKYSGAGTQKAEEELSMLFPGASVLRMDADTTMTRDAYEKGLKAFANGDYDIMIGTQMVAKGLDFPNVTLVGVINADASMYSDDYRSYERTFSLLTQVVGRSGRGTEEGYAVIQTSTPESSVIKLAAEQDYIGFYENEILTRKLMIYPPFCTIMVVGFLSEKREDAYAAACDFLSMLKQKISTEYTEQKVVVLGPTVAAIPRVSRKYRYKLILKCKNSQRLKGMMSQLLCDFTKSTKIKDISVFIDVDPETII